MKKNKKLPMLIISIPIVLSIIIIVWYMVYLNRDDTFDIEEAFVIELFGTQGYGYVDVSVSPDFIEKTGVGLSEFTYNLSAKNMLSNGDVIQITVSDAVGIRLNRDTLNFTVSGLKDGTDMDIFTDLIVTYDKEKKKIILDNSQCSEFIKENVLFSIKRELEEYSEGDVVELIGYVDMNVATENGYNIISTTCEYIVK